MNENQQFQHNVRFEFGNRRGVPFRFWMGIMLVILGTGFLLNVFDILPFGDLIGTYWPSLLMIVALVQLATRSSSFTGAGILFTVGALLQANKLGWIDHFWSAFWPIVLIIVGISMLLNLNNKKKVELFRDQKTASGDESGAHTIDQTSIFSGNETRSNSRAFQGGTLTTVFGSMEVDLRSAEINAQQADLDVRVIFGNTEIRVPPHWHVVTQGTPVLGNIENLANTDVDTNVIGPTLVIHSSVVFGNLEIKN